MFVKITKPYPKYPQKDRVNVLNYDSDEVFEQIPYCRGFVTFKITSDKMLEDVKEYLKKYPKFTRIVDAYPW